MDTPRGDIPRGTTARTARIAALPLAFTGRAVAGWGRRLAGADADAVAAVAMERNAEQLFAVLGQLRGGAQKVGQALAVYESMMPAELAEPYRRALVRLQTEGPALPPNEVHRVLDQQLGRQWRTRLPDLDDVPVAAASIGQVHRARTADGRAVAVKIQYPGADQALDADLRVLERFARLFTLIVPGLDARAVMRELRARTLEELDYRDEAARQRAFAAVFANGTHLHVPAVVAAAPKVLVSEWLDGRSLAELVGRPVESADDGRARDRYAHTIVETMFSSPYRLGLLHSDPHPGNFMVLGDGRLAMIDYGAVATMPGIPPVLARTLRHIADGAPQAMMDLLRSEGFIAGDVRPDDVLAYIGALADPLRVPRFRFDRAWMAAQGARVADLRGAAYRETGRALTLPADHLVFLRVLTGWMNVLAQLDCTVAVRGIVERWVPAFAGADPPLGVRAGRRSGRPGPVTEPTGDDPLDDRRTDEDRDISDVGLPHPGDAESGADQGRSDVDEAALDEVFPPADDRG